MKSSDKTSDLSAGKSVSSLIKAIIGEFEVVMGSPERVKTCCSELKKQISPQPSLSELEQLHNLLPLLRNRVGPIIAPLSDLFDELASVADQPWPLLKGMLSARDEGLVHKALAKTISLAKSGSLPITMETARFFAEQADNEGSPLRTPESLKNIADILCNLALPEPSFQENPILFLYLEEKDINLRSLAAMILDLESKMVSPNHAEQLLGNEAHHFLHPYLDFTQATYTDLLHLVPIPGVLPESLASLEKAQSLCGRELVRNVIAKLGWALVNFGIEVFDYTDISVNESFPFTVSPSEALLLKKTGDFRHGKRSFLFIAHGGLPLETRKTGKDDDLISRFRSLNLVHSEALSFFLSLDPLTHEKIHNILDMMDRIVSDFTILFSSYADECAILPDVYKELRERILSMLEKEESEIQVSTELTRVIQMFEDPVSVGNVQTLHGLKRYLHQRGLRLGFRLLKISHSTDRMVSILAGTPDRLSHVSKCIHYIDFSDDDKSRSTGQIPYPVRVVADGFGRQILHGKENLPDVKIFCYGNEVHYYMTFSGHPAFLRIDYSPPSRGGMIDLEYYGVSKNDLRHHPNLSLDALRQFFQGLGFDITIKETRVQVRYDKEKALDIGNLCEKAEILFRLGPYLMEIDWVIGDLNLPHDARLKVTGAWLEFFSAWGVLPFGKFLTSDRRGILTAADHGPAGNQEIPWSGNGPYQDRFASPVPRDLFEKLQSVLSEIGIQIPTPLEIYEIRSIGQIHLEKFLLHPLRNAVSAGEITETPEGFARQRPEFFYREHEAELFADLLSSENRHICDAASLASLIRPLEQTLRFQTSGSLNSYEVQRAVLTLFGENVTLCVLRDQNSNIGLAMFARGEILCRQRKDPALPWHSNAETEPSGLTELLKRSNYAGMESVPGHTDAEKIRESFGKENPKPRPWSILGERALKGTRISPGRALGTVMFGTKGRMPDDLEGSILVAPSVHPDDNTFLYHTSGIICTDGSILSHAGLIAMQFRKPAMIVHGKWHSQSSSDGQRLLYYTEDYLEDTKERQGCNVTVRHSVHYREHSLQEGDLVVLDADNGLLRVLGQTREALILHENFRNFGKVCTRLFQETDEKNFLELRGRRLRTLYQIQKIMSQLKNPVLACHAIHELLFGKQLSGIAKNVNENAKLLSLVLENQSVGKICHEYMSAISTDLAYRYRELHEKILQRVPASTDLLEILTLRLQAIYLCQSFKDVVESLSAAGSDIRTTDCSMPGDIDEMIHHRLAILQTSLAKDTESLANASSGRDHTLRHRVRQLERMNMVLNVPEEDIRFAEQIRTRVAEHDKFSQDQFQGRRILWHDEAGFEFSAIIGWKAANLAEIGRLGGTSLVPPWFVVTDYAFQEVMDQPLESASASLRDAIRRILESKDADNYEKSQQIRKLWHGIRLPPDLAQDVVAGYCRLTGSSDKNTEPVKSKYVAIRSSAKEEDTETDVRAGEFDTFLFIPDKDYLLEHLRLAWSGLWTERAIHNRSVLGRDSEDIGGGVIVQKNIFSRVSGVLQTVNVAEHEMREIIVNAGLGLGEGIVSGVVAADHFVISKQEEYDSARLSYRPVISEKRDQVVFDEKKGVGTIRTDVLYHQRLRASLEYFELCELVQAACQLEKVYGYPLDMEFCIEGTKIWIVQVRPVPTFESVFRRTVRDYPISVNLCGQV